MLEKTKLTVLFLSTLIVTYGLVGGVLERVSAGDEAYRDLSVFTKVIDYIQRDYVEEPDMKRALKGALHGMMEALDPFSSFVDRETFEILTASNLEAETGLTISKRYGYAHVVAVTRGSPADSNGLRSGDLIEAIDGHPTVLMSLWEAQRFLSGPADSRVALRVIRSRRSEPQEIVLSRRVPAPLGPTAQVVEGGIGLIRIPSFDEGVSEVVGARLKMLLTAEVRGLLVDLRAAAGGSLEEAVALSDLFLPRESLVAELRVKKGRARVYRSERDPLVTELPIVLLVDGGTSGPAEVFAAALRDNGKAAVVGERTNGHGSVQREFRLQDGSMLYISTGMIYRPDGELIQSEEIRRSGLEPDLLSPGRDFVSNFYFDHSAEGGEEGELDDEFYKKLDQAIEGEQFRAAVGHLREKIEESAGKVQREAA